MKKIRFVLTLVLALAMAVGAPLTALAAEWDVSTSKDVEDVFAADTDAEVILNMQNDIVMNNGLYANEGQTYTFNGNGNTISDVILGGSGTVEINGDVAGTDYFAALETYDEVTVTVNGNVTGNDADADD